MAVMVFVASLASYRDGDVDRTPVKERSGNVSRVEVQK